MKLGILVVYLFGAQTAPLLDIHLNRIERYTHVPYTLYASANRLAPEFRQQLASHPKIQICDIPDTDARGMWEHSYYLDHLARIAIQDGVTHAVSLHLDSFPIRQGWIEELASRLSGRCVLSTIDSVNTACLFFHQDFYRRCRPNFLVTEEEHKHPLYHRFVNEHHPVQHSGSGYAYCAYRYGLSWNYLQLTPAYSTDQIGDVFDSMVFHLGQGVRVGEYYPQQTSPLLKRTYARGVTEAWSVYRLIVPADLRRKLRHRFDHILKSTVHRWLVMQQAQRIKQFLKDPEAYIVPIERRVALGL